MSKQRAQQRKCVLVPAYQEAATIASVVSRIRDLVPDVVVVDDGSTDGTAAAARQAGAQVLCHSSNLGKGASLTTGFRHVLDQGYDYVICMDGDGRHDPADLPRFIDAYVRTGIPVLVGNRMADPGAMPPIRRWANRWMSGLLSWAMRQYVPDTQCGFRLYRCDVLPFVEAQDRRFAAESEVLLHVADRRISIGAVPITVCSNAAQSRIYPLRDAWRFMAMLIRYRREREAPATGW